MQRDALRAVLGQLDVWWWGSVTNRMAGLTDDEYFWKPVPDAFCLTRRGDELFYEWPPGSRGETQPPVTTIAWRLSHVAQGCFMSRWHTYFGDGSDRLDGAAVPVDGGGRARVPRRVEDAVVRRAYRRAGEDGMWEPIGDREGDIPIMQLGDDDPFIGLALHMNREVMHHGAEICLLRDLYRAHNVT